MRRVAEVLALVGVLGVAGCGDSGPESNQDRFIKQIEESGQSADEARDTAAQIEREVDAELAKKNRKRTARPPKTRGEPGSRSLSKVDSTADQYELAREIGYELCVDPIYPDKAAADPVGYAEEEFGGPGEFDSAREAGCLEALGQ